MSKETTVEVFPGFWVDLEELAEQRKTLYRVQTHFKDPRIVNDLEGTVNLLHCIADVWDEKSGKNDALRNKIAAQRRKIIKDKEKKEAKKARRKRDAAIMGKTIEDHIMEILT